MTGGKHVRKSGVSIRASRWARLVVVLMSLSLLAAACGGGDDDDDGGGGSDPTTETASDPEDEGEPVDGGDLVYGIEAESDGLNPTTNRFAIAGVEMGLAVFDPLTAFDEAGVAQPYLAESLTPNEDFSVWTIKLRAGIVFHDGTPLTSEAIKVHFEGILADPLTSLVPKQIFGSANPVTIVDDLTATVTMAGSVATFPAWLTAQFGMIASPTWIAAAKEDAALNQEPVGTGPFTIDSRQLNTQTKFVKNPDYWQEGLPHLDSVTFIIATDGQARNQNMQAGDLDMMHTTNPEHLNEYIEDDGFDEYIDELNEETFLMMNMTKPPFDDVRVRQALAYGLDRETVIELNDAGFGTIANGLFHPDNLFYTEVDNFPQYDPAMAQSLIDEYCTDVPAECDGGKITFEYKTTPSPDNDLFFQTVQELWSPLATISKIPVEQAAFITEAAVGNYEMVLYRQFGALDPDYDGAFIDQRSLGAISINWPRLDNDEIQALLLQQREEGDFETRKEIWGEITTKINEITPYIWINHTMWGIVAKLEVNGVVGFELPTGQTSYGMNEGRHSLANIWIG